MSSPFGEVQVDGSQTERLTAVGFVTRSFIVRLPCTAEVKSTCSGLNIDVPPYLNSTW